MATVRHCGLFFYPHLGVFEKGPDLPRVATDNRELVDGTFSYNGRTTLEWADVPTSHFPIPPKEIISRTWILISRFPVLPIIAPRRLRP